MASETSDKRRLLDNTVMLFIMAASVQLLSLAVIPYETRVLGPAVFGKVGLAQAIMSYVQLVLDFGFILSATEKIASKGNDSLYASRVVSSVLVARAILSVFATVVLGLVFLSNEITGQDFSLYFTFLLAYVANAFLPDFLYRGLEEMRPITLRTLAVRLSFVLLVIMFVKSPDDVLLIPIFQLATNIVALVATLIDSGKRFRICFVRPQVCFVKELVKESAPFFGSRIAGTFYQGFSAIVLSAIYGVSPVMGYYAAADKMLAVVKTAASPVADSFYPYMIKNKDYSLVAKVLAGLTPVIVLFIILSALYAEELCALIFGSEYESVGGILRCLLPAAAVIIPSYVICFPVLVPLGLSVFANASNWLGVFLHLMQLGALALINALNVYTLCTAISVTELCVFLFRLVAAIMGFRRLKRKQL